MSDRIITSGTARNVSNTLAGDRLVLDPAERRFVTYTNDVGGVHTIIVDVEHAAKDAEQLVAWFEKTRTIVEHIAPASDKPGHITPAEVLHIAADAFGFNQPPAAQHDQGGG